MPDRFITLSEFFVAVPEADIEPVEPVDVPASIEIRPDYCQAAGEVRRFQAALRDALDLAVTDVLRDIAADVLARELELAPADLDAIVVRACERYATESVVRVRVHPDEAAQVKSLGASVVSDFNLRRGDAVLEVRSGTIDVTLGARLSDVLERVVR